METLIDISNAASVMSREGEGATVAAAGTLSAHQHRSLVMDYNDSASPYPADKTVVELFQAQVARTPNDEAVRLDNQALTYAELNERANQLAAHLGAIGIRREQPVTISMEHSLEVVCAILGVLKAGAAYVPVDPATTPMDRLAFILRDISEGTLCGGASPVLITHSRLVSGLPREGVEVVTLDSNFAQIEHYPTSNPETAASPANLAYVIYTSGSTGKPKGVLIEHRSLVNYIWWANEKYCRGERLAWPLFSSLAFDLTVTSTFTPLVSGGRIVIYRDEPGVHGMAVLKVIEERAVDIVKLTPSHLAMIQHLDLGATKIRTLIVGGEDLKTELARQVTANFGRQVEIYNEYGPTEATVGCMIHRYETEKDRFPSVPIGVPAANAGVYILDEQLNPVAPGVTGEMYLAGDGLARGYLNRPDLTEQKFVVAGDPRQKGPEAGFSPNKPQSLRLYKTGDIARWSADRRMEFLGRADDQLKIGGMRIELGEIESRLQTVPGVRSCVVDVMNSGAPRAKKKLTYCTRCGVESNLPATTYDAGGVCNICRAYDRYVEKAQAYFKTPEEFKALVARMKAARTAEYDCVVLFSGGKDSTYMLYKIKDLGIKALAFTLDNGFLSDEAKENIHRVVELVDVDHIFGTTPHMNEIFVDSLKQFSNVCNGCFKTIYTLATNLAHEKGIRYIITGLSRGQFFETRLTEDVFTRKDFDPTKLDDLVLEARKAYHKREDAVSCHLAVDILQGDGIFDEIQFVDFYRYWSVPLEELYAELKARGAWFRPSDTGRSTNCTINDLGIYLHKKQRGFHNYSLPYSWDVRLNQKTREEAMEELDDEIDEARVKKLMAQIGYTEPTPSDETGIDRLVAYYVSESPLTVAEVRAHLGRELPDYMIPTYVVWMPRLPLTPNGKVDRKALPIPTYEHMQPASDFVRPQTEIENALALIWTQLLKIDNIGINDRFFDLGGNSLLAIRAVSRIRDIFGVDLPIQTLFKNSTIAALAKVLNATKGSGAVERIERREATASAPLSFAQEQLWFLDQLTPGSPVYNMSDVVEVRGRYNAGAMRGAIKELLRRHEILRTAFCDNNGQGIQVIAPEVDVPLAELDLSALPEPEREGQWMRLVHQQVRQPFNLSQAPLLRATIVHLTAREHRLLLTTHHILADEWSMEVVHQEIKRLYDTFAEGHPSPLPDLPIQYADYTFWQRNWLQGEIQESQAAYWKEELAGARFILDLPIDKPRPATSSFRGAMESFHLTAGLLGQLKTLGREQQVTLFMILEAGFMALLHRYTGQDDIVVGTPISGRTHSETENLIGLFLNTVLLRAKFSEHQNFLSLLQQIQERALGAYAHADLPFGSLVAELAPHRDASRTPLFQVMFILHNSEGVSEVSKASGNQELGTGTSKFDLTLILSENEKGVDGLIEYSTDLFEADTIRRFAGCYSRLLEAIASNPNRNITDLPILSTAERQQLLTDWNNTGEVYPERPLCLHQWIEEQVRRTPGQTAVEFESLTLTYRELDRRANQLAHYLQRLGVGPDVLVGLFVERSLDMIVGLLGILKAGGAYVPLDPSFPASRLAHMVEDSRMTVLLTHRDLEPTLTARQPTLVRLDSDWKEIVKESDNSHGLPASSPHSLAYVLYTSGSTGKPKGVQIPHSAIVNFLHSMRREPGFLTTDILLAVTTLSFDIAGLEVYLPLITGGKVVIASREDAHDPIHLMKLMQNSGCTVMQATPATWRTLVQAGWVGSPTLKILCGGEALLRDLAEDLLPRCSELWNMYGPTETTVWSALHKVTSATDSVPIGKPIANTQLYVLNAQRALVPPGAVGELYIGGDGLARGYLDRAELTTERFVPSPFVPRELLYRTGDLARWLPGGVMECLGRVDDQVKIRGFRIELGEIESVLSENPTVKRCVVVAREDVPGDRRLVAFVVWQAGKEQSIEVLRKELRKKLPEYMVPALFVSLKEIPMLPNGKVARAALPAPDENQIIMRGDGFSALNETEQKIAAIWQNTLGIARAGRDQNFFDLGGDSLRLIRVRSALQSTFNREVAMVDMFSCTTVRLLCNLLTPKVEDSFVEDQDQAAIVDRRNAAQRRRTLRRQLTEELKD